MKTSSSDDPYPGRSCLRPVLLLIVLVACIGLAAFAFTTYPASAAFFETPTPTEENLWAPMNLPRPVNTVTAVATATAVPAATEVPSFTATTEPTIPAVPTEESSSQLTMQIVENPSVSSSAADAPAPAPSYGGSKYILVDISEQHMYVYDGDTLVYSFVVSTGIHNATRVGTFAVQSKIPNAYGSTWNIWMPNWLGIYWAGGLENGIHALPILPNGATLWGGYLGTPISYGCVVLGTYESQLLYDWAEIGTPVEIRW